ncbi:MAG: ATP-binding protein [Atopobiaceae bacterium]
MGVVHADEMRADAVCSDVDADADASTADQKAGEHPVPAATAASVDVAPSAQSDITSSAQPGTESSAQPDDSSSDGSSTSGGPSRPAPSHRCAPSLTSRIFAALLVVSVVAVVLATIAGAFVYQNSLMSDAEGQLARETSVLSQAIEQAADNHTEQSVLENIQLGDLRATLIDTDGTVLYDSQSDAATMPNHLDRPEVAEALNTGRGSTVRSSSTMGNISIYQAVLLDSDHVLRLSVDRAGVMAILYNDLWAVVGVVVILVAVAWVVAMFLSRKLVRPILNMYPSEAALQKAQEARERGESARPLDSTNAVRTGGAFNPSFADELMAPAVSPYRELDPLTNRINSQHARLVRQMDQLRDADLMRSEFTANVTHELKTPLQSIQGASELMMEGMVQPEDIEDFSRRIYKEARRLSNLVNDILMLSKLDDTERSGVDANRANCEPVDLFVVTHDVEQRLGPKADDAEVELTLDGNRAVVMGLPRLVDELISNLIDNAIRYNHPGGYVRVWVGQVTGRPTVRVSDTGIGIAPADQQKIFERFYRVEKSRSRASGGTGLGLAIVKHAAAFHHASIDLQSQLGHGSTFTVTFPPLPAD